jgi:hypothetical protein
MSTKTGFTQRRKVAKDDLDFSVSEVSSFFATSRPFGFAQDKLCVRPFLLIQKMPMGKKMTRKRRFEKTNPIWQRHGNDNMFHAKAQRRKDAKDGHIFSAPKDVSFFAFLRLCVSLFSFLKRDLKNEPNLS